MKHNDDFDLILDDALAEYREAEPLAGMEDRILRRVRQQSERRRKFWWQWSVAAATLAVLAVAWIGSHDRARHNVVIPPLARKPIAPVGRQIAAPDRLASQRHTAPLRVPRKKVVGPRPVDVAGHTQVAVQLLPFRGQFPVPAPLNADERALLALAQTHPEALRTLLHSNDEEMAIVPITIQPLIGEGGDQGDN
jgi:hypothetical protein